MSLNFRPVTVGNRCSCKISDTILRKEVGSLLWSRNTFATKLPAMFLAATPVVEWLCVQFHSILCSEVGQLHRVMAAKHSGCLALSSANRSPSRLQFSNPNIIPYLGRTQLQVPNSESTRPPLFYPSHLHLTALPRPPRYKPKLRSSHHVPSP